MLVRLIRTLHPHWGRYTGAHQFVQHLDPGGFRTDVQVVPMGDDQFPVASGLVRLGVKGLVRLRGVRRYGLNDLMAEVNTGRLWWHERFNLLHYLDGEHSLQFLPHAFDALRSLRTRPPVLATLHQPPHLLDPLVNYGVLRRLDRVIVLCPEQVSHLEQRLPRDRISLILHGVDTGFFHPGREPKDDRRLTCLSVGSWLRDYDTVLSVAEMMRSHPEFHFRIVSGAVSAPQDLHNVEVVSGIDDEQLRYMYQQADVLLMPVKAATANNALLEGIACGLPVVSTDLPSVRAYLPGRQAILVPDNDADLIVRALWELHERPELRSEMATSARKRALELSWKQIALEYEALYRAVVDQRA